MAANYSPHPQPKNENRKPVSPLTQEQTIIQNILSGDTAVFARLIDTYQHNIRAYLAKRCANHADADDITQETFIAAFNNLSQYDKTKPFSAWLFGIARNKSNEHFRKQKRIPIPTTPDSSPEPSHIDTPASRLTISEKSSHFWTEAKRILNEQQFTAIWLKYQQDLSIADISTAMDLTQANIKILLFRARKKLATSTTINNLAS